LLHRVSVCTLKPGPAPREPKIIKTFRSSCANFDYFSSGDIHDTSKSIKNTGAQGSYACAYACAYSCAYACAYSCAYACADACAYGLVGPGSRQFSLFGR